MAARVRSCVYQELIAPWLLGRTVDTEAAPVESFVQK